MERGYSLGGFPEAEKERILDSLKKDKRETEKTK
jgi:hypothetical protein